MIDYIDAPKLKDNIIKEIRSAIKTVKNCKVTKNSIFIPSEIYANMIENTFSRGIDDAIILINLHNMAKNYSETYSSTYIIHGSLDL